MDTIIFIIALFGVIYIVIWAIRNDEVDDDSPTTGLLRMTHEEPEKESSDDD